MDEGRDFGSFGMRNWTHADLKMNHMWHLMPGDPNPLFQNGGNFARDFVSEGWVGQRDRSDNRAANLVHAFSSNPMYALNGSGPHAFHILQQPDPQPQVNKVSVNDEPREREEAPLKKVSQGRTLKSSTPKKPKKVPVPKSEISRKKSGKKSEELIINGIDFDLSRIPTPVCCCTGAARQCYKWGVGGWQSACCTRSFSGYPLPVSTKRRGARIAGRKMSLGAFKKVLEKLAGEGYNLSNPIDLKPFWAKHGTNKFAIIR